MLNPTKKDQLNETLTVLQDIGRAVFRFACGASIAYLAAMPFLQIEKQDTPEFWYSVGCYGVFLIGFSSLFRCMLDQQR